MPAYQDTPLATQQINQTQAPIRTNFQSLQSLIDVNHVDFSDPVNFGKHNVSDYFPQPNTPLGSVPSFITGLPTPEFNIYNTIPNGTTVLSGTPNQGYPVTLTSNELIIERALQGGQTKNTFTPITATSQLNDATGQHGWAFLPSGILLKWGYVFFNPAGPTNTYFTFTYPIAANIPVFLNVFNVSITTTGNQNGVQLGGPQVLTMLGDFNATTINLFPRSLIGFQGQNDWTYLSFGVAQSNT
jgi:hypothetical protein